MKAKEEEDFILGRIGNWSGACNTDFLYVFVLKAAASSMKRLSVTQPSSKATLVPFINVPFNLPSPIRGPRTRHDQP